MFLTRSATRVLAALAAVALLGCATPHNPSFPLIAHDADQALAAMRAVPVKLDRPVVVLTGFRDAGLGTWFWEDAVKENTGDARVIGVTFFWDMSFETCRLRVIEAVEKAYPCADPNCTTEVDVVGLSMGGLVARYCTMPRTDGGKTLRIARLFTISSPHRGARLAEAPVPDPLARAMRPGSNFMKRLDAGTADASYPIYAYVQTDDIIVGAENAAAPGSPAAWWVDPEMPLPPHWAAIAEPRIRADILRRLRHEPAYATNPPAPLPPK